MLIPERKFTFLKKYRRTL